MNRQLTSAIFCFATLSAPAGVAVADTLTLRDGTIVTGTYLGGSAREIRVDLGDHVQTFPIDRVTGVQFDANGPAVTSATPPLPLPPPAPGANSAPEPGYSYNNQATNQTDGGYAQAPPTPGNNPVPSNAAGITIPAGTEVIVRMIDAVDSDTTSLGRTYRGSVDEPVMLNGQVVIPRGADVITKVSQDQQANKIAGRTAIGLVMQTINLNGRDVPVTTSDVRQESASRGKRSAGVIGGGTALGAIIGGIAGGGRGAAIGAVSGAAVGTGAEVLTKGEKVHIPSETRLTFTLSNPVTL